jgi:hypothetical protein
MHSKALRLGHVVLPRDLAAALLQNQQLLQSVALIRNVLIRTPQIWP